MGIRRCTMCILRKPEPCVYCPEEVLATRDEYKAIVVDGKKRYTHKHCHEKHEAELMSEHIGTYVTRPLVANT